MAEKMNLAGKTVLFVDDRPMTIKNFIEKVREHGAAVHIRRTIDGAGEIIREQKVDFVVIDLFLDEPGGLFEQYKEHVEQTGTNLGQLLGLYLQEQEIPYLYLSANPSWFVENKQEKEVTVLSKSVRSWAEFQKCLIDHLHHKNEE